MGCGRRSWRATVSFVCALMCAAQSSLVLKIQLGWNGSPWAFAGTRASISHLTILACLYIFAISFFSYLRQAAYGHFIKNLDTYLLSRANCTPH